MYNSDCPICLDTFTNQIYFPFDCKHRICLKCNDSLDDRCCPLCRAPIPIKITRLEYIISLCTIVTIPILMTIISKTYY